VPLRVRPSFSDGEGTLIAPEADEHAPVVTGVALVRDEARVTLTDIPDRPGVMSLIFTKMAERKIPVDMVVQDISSGDTAEVSFTVPQDDLAETLTAADEAISDLGAGSTHHGTNVSKVSIVGSGMRSHTGVAGQMFQALADAEINVGMITTSEIKVSVLVDRDDCDAAVQAVHAAFSLDSSSGESLSIGWETSPEKSESLVLRDQIEREVVAQLASMEDLVVSETQLDSDQARVTISNLPDVPGISATVFTAVAEGGMMVDMIVQNKGHQGQAHLSFTVPKADLEPCLLLVREVLDQWDQAELSYDAEIAKLSVMGIGLRSHTDVGEKMFTALADASINVQMINTSEIRLSAVVALDRGEDALAALQTTFNLNRGS